MPCNDDRKGVICVARGEGSVEKQAKRCQRVTYKKNEGLCPRIAQGKRAPTGCFEVGEVMTENGFGWHRDSLATTRYPPYRDRNAHERTAPTTQKHPSPTSDGCSCGEGAGVLGGELQELVEGGIGKHHLVLEELDQLLELQCAETSEALFGEGAETLEQGAPQHAVTQEGTLAPVERSGGPVRDAWAPATRGGRVAPLRLDQVLFSERFHLRFEPDAEGVRLLVLVRQAMEELDELLEGPQVIRRADELSAVVLVQKSTREGDHVRRLF